MEKLSEDLLYLVFLRASPSDFSWREPSGAQPSIRTITPFNFSLVCRSWRTIVLLRARLWSFITIEDHNKSTRRIDRFCRTIEEWLRLSSTSPLTIRIRLGQRLCKSSGHLPISLLRLFHQECHRWEDVDIEIHNNSLHKLNDILELPISSHLSFLSLKFIGANKNIARVNLSPLVTGTSSNLQVLDLSGAALVCTAPRRMDVLHLSNLRELAFQIEHDSDLDDSLYILSASPSLRKLRLVDFPTIPATLTSQGIVSLRNLTDFFLISRTPSTTSRLLGLLVCPALKSAILYIHSPLLVFGPLEPMLFCLAFDFVRFFSRSRPPLVSLQLFFDTQDIMLLEREAEYENALTELFSLVGGTLERLICVGSVVDSTLVKVLSDRCARDLDTSRYEVSNHDLIPTLLCPSLSEMLLSCSSNSSFFSEDSQKSAVENMIVSRWKGGEGALKRVELYLPGLKKFVEQSVRLRACVGEGLYLPY